MKKTLHYTFGFLLTSVSLYAEDLDIGSQDEGLTLWIALFGLGIVGLLGLFISSNQLDRFKKKTKDSEEHNSKMNQTQSQILSNMGEHIQNIAKETVDTAQKLSVDHTKEDINKELSKVVHSERKLLAITTNLIEFLQIKSKKIKIVHENLQLSNLLNDVSGTLKANTKELELELTYNIKNNIPEDLIGDTLNLSKVLVNLILYSIENGDQSIELKISKSTLLDTLDAEESLYFNVQTGLKIDVSHNENIFNSNYNEETNTYDSLGLFIAKELSGLMDGTLIAKNNKDGFVEFLLTLPYQKDKTSKQKTPQMQTKKILLVSDSEKSASNIKNMLNELNHKVKIASKEEALLNPLDFSPYDIAIIEEQLFSKKLASEILNTSIKIIKLTNLFKSSKRSVSIKTDAELSKPTTRKDIAQAIEQLYIPKKAENTQAQKDTQKEQALLVHRGTFEDAKNIDLNRFAEFRGTNILLVEDNLINQKVLMGVLSKSAINITVANDGQEALDILHSDKSFDIVFMDINMPIMDGYTATALIRKEQKFNKLPIIALSALASKSEVDRMFGSGMNGYLGKPLKKEKLFTVFSTFIEKRATDRRAKKRQEKDLTSLEGLNIFNGVAQSSSNEIFYKEILMEFKDAYGDSAKVFKNLVTDLRYEQLRMFCVDIKGLSGAIGAEDLHNLTTEVLQRLLYKKYNLLPSYIALYEKELDKINKSIDLYIS